MIIIIGAGISGLYLGHLLKKSGKDFLIIEKDSRYGGRVHVDDFEGESVVLGAGIGRLEKDKTLYDLCKSLSAPVHTYTSTISRIFSTGVKRNNENNKNNENKFLKELDRLTRKSKSITPHQRSTTTFLEYLKQNCDNPYDFIKLSGYTDYINADIIDTIDDYGFDDVTSGYTGFSIEWDTLIDNLYQELSDNVRLSESVTGHNKTDKIIRTEKGIYHYDKLVCSTPVSVTRTLFPEIRILQDLNCQPFSRIFARIGEGRVEMAETIKNFTIVDSYLQKIIPVDTKKGIYMIGYNDNQDADEAFIDFTTLTETQLYDKISSELKRIFKFDVAVQFAKIAYWPDGTTYYKPLPITFRDREEWLEKARNPVDNIYFVGEGFSRNQGWVQGSLESVDAIYPYL